MTYVRLAIGDTVSYTMSIPLSAYRELIGTITHVYPTTDIGFHYVDIKWEGAINESGVLEHTGIAGKTAAYVSSRYLKLIDSATNKFLE